MYRVEYVYFFGNLLHRRVSWENSAGRRVESNLESLFTIACMLFVNDLLYIEHTSLAKIIIVLALIMTSGFTEFFI
jgi:hypothetical protein